MAKKLKDFALIPAESKRAEQNFAILNVGWDDGFLWSLELQAPISSLELRENLRKNFPETGRVLTEWGDMRNIREIIKDNKAGPHGETLAWEEIIELYS